MNKIKLSESFAEAPTKQGNRWRVIVARPGQGSSGVYSEELFRRDAHKIVPAGAQSFINHETNRNPKDMIGVYPEGAYFDESENAVVAELEVFSHWKDFVEEVGPHCGISLYAMGETDEEGNVTEIFEHRSNGADLVARPGLIGSGLANKLYESATDHSKENPGTRQVETKETKLDKETLDAALKPLADALATLVADRTTAEAAEAQVEADEAAVTSAVESYAEAIEAIDAADLFPAQVESLRQSAKAGKDVAPLIEEAKTIKEAALEAAGKQSESVTGRVLESGRYESATDLGKVFG